MNRRQRMRTMVWGLVGVALLAGLAPAAEVYVKKGTWIETLLATRDQCRRGMEDIDIVLGPWYRTAALQAGSFDKALFPEQGVDLDAKDASGKALWRRASFADGQVHKLQAGSACATYLFRTIRSGRDRELPVALGSDDGITVWVNGKRVHAKDVPRGIGGPQDHVTLPLKAGENELLLRIYNISGDHGFYFAAADDPLAAVWAQFSRDWPRQSAWMQADLSGGDLAWLAEGDAAQTRRLVSTVVDRLGGTGRSLATRLDAVDATDEAALLDVYAQACVIRENLKRLEGLNLAALRRAIEDLNATYGRDYRGGRRYLERLDKIEQAIVQGQAIENLAQEALALQREALLANPLLDFEKILVVRRRTADGKGPRLGLPQNWQGNCSLPRSGYDDQIDTIPVAVDGPLETVFRPAEPKFVGDVDLHFDADRMLFSAIGSHNRWQIWEVGVDGKGLRQVTPGKYGDVDNYDACYLPDGRIVFDSTRCFQGIPCVGGADTVANLYLMNADGTGVRQLCFDQDHNWCPTVMNNGRVLYARWEYSDTPHYFSRLMFTMNPDGTNQMAYYGSNSYWPNSLFYARPIPDHPSKFVGIVSGHHGVARMGELYVFDPAKGRFEADGVVQQIPGYGKTVEAKIVDQLVDGSWPKFLHPYPLSEKYFLAAAQPTSGDPWGIYLVDVFDNMLLLKAEPGCALLEPIPLRKTPPPPVVPDKVDLRQKDALVYLTDIYFGPGLAGVPRGTVKALRLYSFHYGYPNMGGHVHVAVEGGWDVHRIMGTVPVESDGSAFFRVPANTPIAVQPLDEKGRAVQIMRSWFTAMPGEVLSCVGCHEQQNASSPNRFTQAARRTPSPIRQWRGPERGFSFKREVQPVLDRHCVGCHDGTAGRPDFRRKDRNSWGNFTPSYLALHPYVRRPGPESDYHLYGPMEYHARTSELVQMLEKGHHGVRLDAEAWDVLHTWIDLNVPDHGTWQEHRAIPANFRDRRQEMRTAYALRPADEDPERIPSPSPQNMSFVEPEPVKRPVSNVQLTGWPLEDGEAKMRQLQAGNPQRRTIDLGGGVTMELVHIPAGRFIMGSDEGALDEAPRAVVSVDRPFWMGRFEVTCAQFARFDPDHFNGYIDQNNKDHTTPGYPIHDPDHPVVRVTWHEAMAFCEWLGDRTGLRFTLPTEAQWEWACRAGADTAMSFGTLDADFGPHANLADRSVRRLAVAGVNPQPIANPSPYEDWIPKDARFDDGQRIMCPIGQYQANRWGLHDMHGNAAEWTRSVYQPYPYREDDGRNDAAAAGRRVVRGGSWRDRPHRATASFRLAYEPWQAVFNVGFRVLCEEGPDAESALTMKR